MKKFSIETLFKDDLANKANPENIVFKPKVETLTVEKLKLKWVVKRQAIIEGIDNKYPN